MQRDYKMTFGMSVWCSGGGSGGGYYIDFLILFVLFLLPKICQIFPFNYFNTLHCFIFNTRTETRQFLTKVYYWSPCHGYCPSFVEINIFYHKYIKPHQSYGVIIFIYIHHSNRLYNSELPTRSLSRIEWVYINQANNNEVCLMRNQW